MPTAKIEVLTDTSATSWLGWRRKFEAAAAFQGWNDAAQKFKLLSSLSNNIIADVADIPTDNITGQQLLDLYQNRFISPADTAVARALFTTGKQGPGETIRQFATALRSKFIRAYPGRHHQVDEDPDLILRFTQGLIEQSIAMHCLQNQPATLQAALTLAEAKYSAIRVLEGAKAVRAIAPTQGGTVAAFPGQAQGTGERLCLFCDRPGHLIRDCYHFLNYKRNRGNGRGSFRGNRRGNSGNSRGGRGGPFRPYRPQNGSQRNQVSVLSEAAESLQVATSAIQAMVEEQSSSPVSGNDKGRK